MRATREVPLPRGWASSAKDGLLHAMALARAAVLGAYAGFEESPLGRARAAAEFDRLQGEVARLREEMRIKDARTARIPPARRPHFQPVERLAILELRAASGWSAAETARRFQVAPLTIALWMRRLDEGGEGALLQTRQPVNRFPGYVREIVRALKVAIPSLGRAGLQLAPTTVSRFVKREPRRKPPEPGGARATRKQTVDAEPRVVFARYPHHLWHVDLTIVPTMGGLWVPWIPKALVQRWPFAVWVCAVLDHFSRAVVGHAVFRKEPTAREVGRVLDRAIRDAGRAPRYIVSDRGVQFQEIYRGWCARRGVHPRFGAIGKKGSIAVVERFFRSLKDEHFRRIVLPLSVERIRCGLAAYVRWYNEARAAQHARPRDAAGAPRRPRGRGRALRDALAVSDPRIARRATRRGPPRLALTRAEGAEHLPVVALREAA